MDENKGYINFKIVFHMLIFIFAIGLIIASIVGWHELDRALLYLILGVVFALDSVFRLYKNFRNKLAH